jgi:hypothetical protein
MKSLWVLPIFILPIVIALLSVYWVMQKTAIGSAQGHDVSASLWSMGRGFCGIQILDEVPWGGGEYLISHAYIGCGGAAGSLYHAILAHPTGITDWNAYERLGIVQKWDAGCIC